MTTTFVPFLVFIFHNSVHASFDLMSMFSALFVYSPICRFIHPFISKLNIVEINQCVYQLACLFFIFPVSQCCSFIYPSVCLIIYLSACLFNYWPCCLFVHLYVYSPACEFVATQTSNFGILIKVWASKRAQVENRVERWPRNKKMEVRNTKMDSRNRNIYAHRKRCTLQEGNNDKQMQKKIGLNATLMKAKIEKWIEIEIDTTTLERIKKKKISEGNDSQRQIKMGRLRSRQVDEGKKSKLHRRRHMIIINNNNTNNRRMCLE